MSYSKPILWLVLVGTLSGCGFQPLYGRYSAAPVASEDLAAIRVDAIPDRTGQQLRIALEERLYGARAQVEPTYTLTVKTSTSSADLGIRRDDTASRARVTLEATYVVHARGQEGVLVGGQARAIASYDLLEANFASVMAERTAQEQATRDIADQIVARLATYFTARRAAARPQSP